MKLKNLINKIYISDDRKNLCEKATNNFLVRFVITSNRSIMKDVKNAVILLINYCTTLDEIENIDFIKSLINNIKLRDVSLGTISILNRDVTDKEAIELSKFILIIEHLDEYLYNSIVELLVNICLINGILNKKEFDFILNLVNKEQKIDYDLKWNEPFVKKPIEPIKVDSKFINEINNGIYNITFDKNKSLSHLHITNNKIMNILNVEKCEYLFIPKSVNEFKNRLFYGNKYLKAVKFEEGFELDTLPSKFFAECSNLEYVDISNTNIKKIKEDCFLNCYKLTEINGIEQIECIEKEAFNGAFGLLWDFKNNTRKFSNTGNWLLNNSKTVWTKKINENQMNKYIGVRFVEVGRVSPVYTYSVDINSEINIGDELYLNKGDELYKYHISESKKVFVSTVFFYDGNPKKYFPFVVKDYPNKIIKNKATAETLNYSLKYITYDKIITKTKHEIEKELQTSSKMKAYGQTLEDFNEFDSYIEISDENKLQNSIEYIENNDFDTTLYNKAKKEFYDNAYISNNVLVSLNYYPEILIIPSEITIIGPNALNKCYKTKRLIFEKRNHDLEINYTNFKFLVSLATIDITNNAFSFDSDFSTFINKYHIIEFNVANDNPKYTAYNNALYSKEHLILYKIFSNSNNSLDFFVHPNTISFQCGSDLNCNYKFIHLNKYLISKNLFISNKEKYNLIDCSNSELMHVFGIYTKMYVKPILFDEPKIGDGFIVYVQGKDFKENDTISLNINDSIIEFKITKIVSYSNYINGIKDNRYNNCFFKAIKNNNNDININVQSKIPLILDDDYPFNYDKNLISEINQARKGDRSHIEYLINYYKDKNTMKYEYWNNKLNNK